MQTMNTRDACKILGISGDINPDIVKQAYRRACAKYHPDKNPAGLEMMKYVNLAYEALKDTTETINLQENAVNYGEDLNAAIGAIIDLGLNLELCGAWLWVSGDTKPHKDILKDNGFRWAPKKQQWYFRPEDYRSYSRGKYTMDEIREKYGSKTIRPGSRQRLAAM